MDFLETLLVRIQAREDQAWAAAAELQEKAGRIAPARLAECKAAILDNLAELRRLRTAILETIEEHA